jgi:hypothetical protein
MEKVYQINMYEHDGGDGYDCTTLGIFTNEDVAKGIVMKFEKDLGDKLNELYVEAEVYENDDTKRFIDANAEFLYYSPDYLAIEGEMRELQRTSYEIREIIINQLFN